jgi:hypothetical protein
MSDDPIDPVSKSQLPSFWARLAAHIKGITTVIIVLGGLLTAGQHLWNKYHDTQAAQPEPKVDPCKTNDPPFSCQPD